MKILVFMLSVVFTSLVCFAVPVAVDDNFTSVGYIQKCANGKWSYNCPVTAEAFGDPVIFFSDLDYGPKTGWEGSGTEGAVVTIWGRNFGTVGSRDSNFVTVNGISLTSNSDYVDSWAKINNPVPFLQTITFKLNSSMADGTGTIAVTVGGTPSNTIPFRIGAGNIYYVSASAPPSGTDGSVGNPFDPTDVRSQLAPGDVVYFRGGTYDQMYNGGKSNLWYRSTDPQGTITQPIALVGYPNEIPYFDGVTLGDTSNFNKCLVFDNEYMTIAKMKTECVESAIRGNDYSRIIGNDLIGATQFVSGAGIISANSNGMVLYGNTIHGGRSRNKLDHAVYFSGCTPDVGSIVAHNYIYDNDFEAPTSPSDPGYGALIVDNHQDVRCSSSEQMKVTRIHSNLISCENYLARSVGIFDRSWDNGEANEPEPALVYNNISINCGVPSTLPIPSPDMYHNNGNAYFYNNMLYATFGGISPSGGLVLISDATNNAIIRQDVGDIGDCVGSSATTIANNAGEVCTVTGSNTVSGDLKVTFTSSTDYTPFTVALDSPLLGAGLDTVNEVSLNGDLFTVVERDFYGNIRPETGIDIGAIEVNQ